MKTYSRLNHVFNCAGINPTAMPTTEVTDEYWNKILTTNLTGNFNISRASIPHLSSSSSHPSTIHPSILNTSSIAGLAPTAGFTPYCSSKFAIIGLSKCLALELGPRGIRVNALAPGYIDTPTNACVVRGEEGVREAEGRVALGRMGSVVEVVDVVLFLLGEGGRYVNGSVVEVSGGIF
ncbi:hypothetical protein B0J14DRAFT_599530 [Halenospora varia]|nr:hypothetical protein B0J14DRAFT_599530 [Halenospora varia]